MKTFKTFLYFALFLIAFLPTSVLAESGEPSEITYTGEPLVCGHIYTSEDLIGIQSGSIMIADDGKSMIFENLNINFNLINSHVFDVPDNTTVVLKGENRITTGGYAVMEMHGEFTLTGDGSLTTMSKWFDFLSVGNWDIVIDNTTLICEGPTSIGSNMYQKGNVIVKNSTFKGKKIFRKASLLLLRSAFVSPSGVFFDQNELDGNQLKDADGNYVENFDIQPVAGEYNNRVAPKDFGNVIVSAGATKNMDVTMTNVGEQQVSEISYVLTINGYSHSEQTFALSESYGTGKSFTVPVTFPASDWTGKEEAAILVTKVNGQENTSDHKTAQGILNTLISGEPSRITYKGEALVCGHTYTSEDLIDIQSGSITISDDGTSMTFENLFINDESEQKNGFLASRDNNCVITLKGVNRVSTISSTIIAMINGSLTLTGDGSLTTKSDWIDIFSYECEILIDSTTLTCEGKVSIGNNMWPMNNVIVRNSTFKGTTIFRMASLTLLQCTFVSPDEVYFDPNEMNNWASSYISMLKDANGYSITNFEIQPVEGDFNNRVSPWDFGTVIVEKGNSKTMEVSMKNDGEEPVRELSYVLTIDRTVLPEQTFICDEPYAETGRNVSVPVSFPATDTAGSVDVLVTVTKVNGHVNTSDRKTAKGILVTISQSLEKRAVIEEFTGTWCGWCPRGIVALDLLNKDFGDRVITIAVHYGDPMVAESYSVGSTEFPNARVNRGSFIDPYYGSSFTEYGIKDDIARELDINAPAGISVSAAWADENQTSITTESETIFVLETDVTQYGIGYVLMEDDMKGTENGWAQKNFYTGESIDDQNLQSMTALPYMITDIEYNHVAVDAWGINDGVDNCFETLHLYEPQKNVYLCDISSNVLIQDKSRLSLVAILFDKKTGKIVNAAKTFINNYDLSAIREIHTEKSRSSAVYSINGYRVTPSTDNSISNLPKGIYIIDGRKFVVK